MPDTQYFTNIDGKYVKDAEARQQLNDLEDYVESLDQPWQPLQDGYSNFWFELTNDTLSPWLKFGTIDNDAVIDWGDGSGEQALTTVTPTHTYAKAGKYVVKVKGANTIAEQNVNARGKYFSVLKYVELNSDVSSLSLNAFKNCCGLVEVVMGNSPNSMGSGILQFAANLVRIILSTNFTFISNYAFYYNYSLENITIPSLVATIGTSAFQNCLSLTEIHCLPTSPPTLSTSVFSGLPSDFIIYVPVGTAETYKAAAGWSTYADHILEEGQTPNRAMLAKFNEKTDEPQDDMR